MSPEFAFFFSESLGKCFCHCMQIFLYLHWNVVLSSAHYVIKSERSSEMGENLTCFSGFINMCFFPPLIPVFPVLSRFNLENLWEESAMNNFLEIDEKC